MLKLSGDHGLAEMLVCFLFNKNLKIPYHASGTSLCDFPITLILLLTTSRAR